MIRAAVTQKCYSCPDHLSCVSVTGVVDIRQYIIISIGSLTGIIKINEFNRKDITDDIIVYHIIKKCDIASTDMK